MRLKTGERRTRFSLILLIAASIGLPLHAAAQTGSIAGKVTGTDAVARTSAPLVGATVSSGKISTTTDAEGQYKLTLSPGKYTVTFSYTGYKTQTQNVVVAADVVTTWDILLQTAPDLNEVVVIGSRALPRTRLESPVPVDVLDAHKLSVNAPQVTLGQLLNYAAPSFSSNTQSLGDGTDHVDPASLRGLGPDQVLVLINGKRRYNSALVNVNGTFGKGSVGTDLNAIPVSSIERIEILRDGAAAQYGSDAIAGVINIILRKNIGKLDASVTGGGYVTNSNGQHIHDGSGVQAALNFGLPIGTQGGFINFSGSYDLRNPTNRGGVYNGTIYKRYPGGVDKTDSFLQATNTTRKDYSLIVGQSKLRSGQFEYNASVPVGENATFYSFGGLGYRNGLSPGFYRYPNDSRNVLTIYPLGFLPYIGSNIYDRSFVLGIKGKLNEWNVDFSNTFGQNEFNFNVQNSLNASLLNSSPTSFNCGGPRFTQNTTNADLSRQYDVLSGLNLAFGGEYRFERYQLLPGDPDSYTNYGTATRVGTDGGGNPILVPDPNGAVNTLFGPDGTARAGGAQVFPGFRPANAVNATRTAVALYADLELNFSKAFLADGAIRFENYSDFGSTTNGKLALRYKLSDQLSVRASGSTGFRAPSLQQRYYANTATVFTNGVANDVGTFSNDSRAARLVGIPSLKPEKSKSVSAGLTGNYGRFKITVDGYLTRIDDRVIYTDQFSGNNAPGAPAADSELYVILSQANASKAQFFANAINTETRGIDLVLSYTQPLGSGVLTGDVSGTISQTRQVGPINSSALLKGKESIYFSNASRVYLENAVPNQKLNITLNYAIRKWNIFLRNVYFGKVTEATATIANQQHYTPRWVTDLVFGYTLAKGIKLSAGANNLFDIYPDKIAIAANSNGGQFIYSRSAEQFGFNGRYLFGRIEINL